MILRYKILYFGVINYYTTLSFTWWGKSEVGSDVKQGSLCKGQRCESSPASRFDYNSPASGEQCGWTVILDVGLRVRHCQFVCLIQFVLLSELKKNRAQMSALKLLSVFFNHSQLISASLLHIS